MNISRFILMVILQLSVSIVFADSPGNIPISFPFFQSSQSTGIPDELMVGYGDWCVAFEGIHPGTDFFAASGIDQVLNPFDQTMYSLGAEYEPDPDYVGYSIGIGSYGSDDGWALIHLGDDEYDYSLAERWCEDHARNTELPARVPIDKCSQYCSMPRHLHVQWSHWEFEQGAPGVYVLNNPWETLENPFSSFVPGALLGYDQVSFKRVWAESSFLGSDSTNSGVFLLPEGDESYSDYVADVGSSQISGFQKITHGAIDIAVSPFSQQSAYQINEGNGIFSVGYEIFHQNPFSEEWESTESDEGNWGYRELFQAEGQIEEPAVFEEIYEALFMDAGVTYFHNAYIVTNSHADDPTGWDNVYTDISPAYVNDWNDGICQGA
ncbi:MAG: hypothetical protein KAH54_08190, partial [Candidatus Sabulitectum sp.]|nr:hypothetical protein [Candidatus Sabulitectum sp.]